MWRPAARVLTRSVLSGSRRVPTAGHRFLTTEAPHLRSRSWKSSAARWGIAIAGIYYYNTSPVFAEQPQNNLLNPNLEAIDDAANSTALDILAGKPSRPSKKQTSTLESIVEQTSNENASVSTLSPSSSSSLSEAAELVDITDGGSPAALEQEAEGEGAFNPETGEINWDCPCLGGMAHGPCGPEFREAFSCFVFSKEEPKGMDCIEKFQGMQECFAKHPEVYKAELEDNDEIEAELDEERQKLVEEIAERKEQAKQGAESSAGSKKPSASNDDSSKKKLPKSKDDGRKSESAAADDSKTAISKADQSSKGKSATSSKEHGEHITSSGREPDEYLVPKAAHDARGHVGPAPKNEK